jgi:FG-GAP repeat.
LIRGDYDLDGDDDLFISHTDERQSTDQLILINENGVFKKIDAKINHPGVDYFAVSHDYDNDGHIDIIIINSLGIKIYKNNGFAEFVDMSKSSGIYINNYPNNLGFFDYDLEGDLDMYISSNGNNQLFRNNSDGTFTDISTDSDVMANGENTLNQVFGDFDDDGDVDMIVLNENNSIVYYDNIRQGYFRDLTKNSGLSHNGKPSSINVADYNNDGYLDIYISDLEGSHSLYKNNGEGRFIYDSKFLQTNNFFKGFFRTALGVCRYKIMMGL